MNRSLKLTLISSLVVIASSFAPHVYAAEPLASVEGDMPDSLRKLVYSVIGTVEDSPRSLAQARRRAEKAAREAASVMRSQGYYSATVEFRIDTSETDKSEKPDKRQPVLLITPGTQFTVSDVEIFFDGIQPDISSELYKSLKLKPTGPALAADVVSDEMNVINTLRSRGFADATELPRQVVVDHQSKTMKVRFNIAAGDKTKFGKVIQSGSAQLSGNWPKMVAPFETGGLYNEKQLHDLTSRVLATNAFKGASAELDEAHIRNEDGSVTRNVLLHIDQGKRNTISGEIGVSTSDGSGVDLIYERRNPFLYAETVQLKSTIKTNQISVGLNYKIPYAWRVDRSLDAGIEIAREETDAFTGERLTSKAVITQKFNRHYKVSAGLGFEASQYLENGQDVRAYLIEGLGHATYDARDSLLDPSVGYLLEADAIPSYNFGAADGLFTTVELGASLYQRISGSIVAAGRAKAGTIFGAGQDSVPLNRRYYAGGGGSVRGFGYQTISPLDATDANIGGRSLIEGSFELRYRGESPYGFAVFADAGTVGRESFSEFETVRYGLGAGLRYHTSFAPLRADIAVPLNKRPGDADVQVYISIGQAF
ncbi:MAG: BamA/TamA family outer membrane protein [Hyphomonadaceae bacterium]|nr:BamA/TamA family outer membrane protein [Hyphomonadaceae bacterium]